MGNQLRTTSKLFYAVKTEEDVFFFLFPKGKDVLKK